MQSRQNSVKCCHSASRFLPRTVGLPRMRWLGNQRLVTGWNLHSWVFTRFTQGGLWARTWTPESKTLPVPRPLPRVNRADSGPHGAQTPAFHVEKQPHLHIRTLRTLILASKGTFFLLDDQIKHSESRVRGLSEGHKHCHWLFDWAYMSPGPSVRRIVSTLYLHITAWHLFLDLVPRIQFILPCSALHIQSWGKEGCKRKELKYGQFKHCHYFL